MFQISKQAELLSKKKGKSVRSIRLIKITTREKKNVRKWKSWWLWAENCINLMMLMRCRVYRPRKDNNKATASWTNLSRRTLSEVWNEIYRPAEQQLKTWTVQNLHQKLIESYKNSTWLHIQKDRNYNINWIRSHHNCVRVWRNLLRNLFCLKFSYKILKLEK